MWGADTAEVPRGDASFAPTTEVVTSVNALQRRRGGRPVRLVLHHHARRPRAEGDPGPAAGRRLRRDRGAVVRQHDGRPDAGRLADLPERRGDRRRARRPPARRSASTFQRNVAVPKPATTLLSEAPKVAILANANAAGVVANNDTRTALKTIFGAERRLRVAASPGPTRSRTRRPTRCSATTSSTTPARATRPPATPSRRWPTAARRRSARRRPSPRPPTTT